jgi:hypothetical protein
MNIVIIEKSHRPDKKFNAIVNGTRIIPFGSKGYEDYTTHHDDLRQQRYIIRHRKAENWDDPTTPGALSRWLLWNKKSLQSSIDDMNQRFKNYRFILRL